MLLLLAIGIGTLAGCGTWLLLRARTFDTVLGLTLLTYAVNLFIFTMGRVRVGAAPVLQPGVPAVCLLYTSVFSISKGTIFQTFMRDNQIVCFTFFKNFGLK